jgi:hypothetical protein
MKMSPGEASFQPLVQRARVGNHEPESVAMHAQLADHHVLAGSSLRNRIALRIQLHQLAGAYELVQPLVQFATCVAVQSQFAQQLFQAGGVLGLAGDFLENGGV